MNPPGRLLPGPLLPREPRCVGSLTTPPGVRVPPSAEFVAWPVASALEEHEHSSVQGMGGGLGAPPVDDEEGKLLLDDEELVEELEELGKLLEEELLDMIRFLLRKWDVVLGFDHAILISEHACMHKCKNRPPPRAEPSS